MEVPLYTLYILQYFQKIATTNFEKAYAHTSAMAMSPDSQRLRLLLVAGFAL